MNKPSILLFDGVCNLCNGVVQFILSRDLKGNIKFASLQSGTGQKFLKQYNLNTKEISTIVLIQGDRAYTKSTAALRLCLLLKNLWPVLYAFIIIPKSIRDVVYDWIAKNRYRWFGKSEQCMIPSKEHREKFLD
ncbi:thiol-disulfide oxidoreductase DCC family protein [Chengkuizengella sediminis]|uniref:thiol-disulfide oxidoreductase DCC family protein n=1 Tax=Chengkuizengella sediminis TaxID=1885917 RepID=UPI00138A0E48|nr:thiol-disulfide oxidoreductase DCC family protein [Chengkuizengella sediminis]NDI34106.1 thiol-disulfide oxidoreductase DCC family protein [Chengkuizengella sediminis]